MWCSFWMTLTSFQSGMRLAGCPDALIITMRCARRFVEDVNAILNVGEVPNLFAPDETDKVISAILPHLRSSGRPETRDEAWAFFVAGVRSRLHLVLCMSPVGDVFRTRCRQFPSLINCTTIDWFLEWPRVALVSVASKMLAGVELPSDDIRAGLAETCADAFVAVTPAAEAFYGQLRRRVFTTPKSFLDMIGLYVSMLGDRRAELALARQRMAVGAVKLDTTAAAVTTLQADLVKLQPTLALMASQVRAGRQCWARWRRRWARWQRCLQAEVLLAQVEVEQKDAQLQRLRVEAEQAMVQESTNAVRAQRKTGRVDWSSCLLFLVLRRFACCKKRHRESWTWQCLPLKAHLLHLIT